MAGGADKSLETPKNKGGRPRKHPVGTRRPTLAFRVRGDMYERLKEAAERSDRSISEEIEHAVSRHLSEAERQISEKSDPATNVAATIRQALVLAELSSGGKINEGPEHYEAAMAAIDVVKSLIRRPSASPDEPKMPLSTLGSLGSISITDEEERARAIGWAAASQAVLWEKGNFDHGEPFLMLLSRGRLADPSFDRSALLSATDGDKRTQNDTQDAK